MLTTLGLLPFIAYAAANGGNSESEKESLQWTGTCASGKAQSPIDINLSIAVVRDFPALVFKNYDVLGTVIVSNNGHTEILQGFTAWPQQPMLSGGGLTGRYMLQQFHFHWDQSRDLGSEHTIDKLHYALEAHFVHALENLTIEQAARIPYGIAILAVFFAISDTPSQLRQLENLFDMTTAFGSYNSVTYRANDLLPEDREVWFLYSGSLTTPPCSENVIWTLLAEPIYVEESQLEELRHRVSNTGALLVRNRREVQPLNNRVIYMRARKGNGAAHCSRSLFVIILILQFSQTLNK